MTFSATVNLEKFAPRLDETLVFEVLGGQNTKQNRYFSKSSPGGVRRPFWDHFGSQKWSKMVAQRHQNGDQKRTRKLRGQRSTSDAVAWSGMLSCGGVRGPLGLLFRDYKRIPKCNHGGLRRIVDAHANTAATPFQENLGRSLSDLVPGLSGIWAVWGAF